MEQTIKFNFKGFGNCDSTINLYIFQKENLNFIIFEDLNIGTSVTNASEIITSKVVKDFKLNPITCRFFEYYPSNHNNLYFKDVLNDDTKTVNVDEITYEWILTSASEPSWSPISWQELKNLIL